MTTIADLEARLADLHIQTAQTPLFNPVFQLGMELSRSLEAGTITLDTFEGLVAELECEGLRARAARLRRLVGPMAPGENAARLRALAASACARGVHRAPDLPSYKGAVGIGGGGGEHWRPVARNGLRRACRARHDHARL